MGGTRLQDLRTARDTGRLRDLSATPYRQRLSFEPTADTRPASSPWTGLLYSPNQMLVLPELKSLLAKQTSHRRGKVTIARLPKPANPVLPDRVERLRKVAVALVALEARYLPALDPEFIQVTNVLTVEDWAAYRESRSRPARLPRSPRSCRS